MNNDPTGFKTFFPWIHPTDWSYPLNNGLPNHTRGLLDGLGTTINIISEHTHTHIYFERPVANSGFYEEEPTRFGELKIHLSEEPHLYSHKILHDYFTSIEFEDPELTHFKLMMNSRKIIIPMLGRQFVVKEGNSICINARLNSIGVQKGVALEEGSDFICYPHSWLHPTKDKKMYFKKYIKNGTFVPLPKEAGFESTMHILPDLD